jgi:hypothetical protein
MQALKFLFTICDPSNHQGLYKQTTFRPMDLILCDGAFKLLIFQHFYNCTFAFTIMIVPVPMPFGYHPFLFHTYHSCVLLNAVQFLMRKLDFQITWKQEKWSQYCEIEHVSQSWKSASFDVVWFGSTPPPIGFQRYCPTGCWRPPRPRESRKKKSVEKVKHPLLPTGIGDSDISQTISIICFAAPFCWCELPLAVKCWTNSLGPLQYIKPYSEYCHHLSC